MRRDLNGKINCNKIDIFSFNDIDLSHNMLVDCRVWRHREWGAMVAVG